MMENLESLDIKEFTNICNELVTAMGLKITNTVSRENIVAIDSISNLPGEERYLFIFVRKDKVNEKDMRDLVDLNAKDIKWVVVTTGSFDSDAIIFGTKHDILLVNGDGFRKMLEDYDVGIEREKEKGTFLPSVGEIESNIKWSQEFLKSGNYEKALEYVENALKIKETADGLLLKSKILFEMKRFDDSLDTVLKAISISPEIYEPWLMLGKILSGMGKYGDAEKAYLKAIEIDPDNKISHYEFSNFLLLLKRLDEALLEINRAIEIDKKDPELWLTKAKIYHEKGNIDDANKCLDIVLEIDKNKKNAKIMKAEIFFETKDYENAKKMIEGIEDLSALKLMAKILIEEKRFNEAREKLKEIIEKYPGDLEARDILKNLDSIEMDEKIKELKNRARELLDLLEENLEIPEKYDDLQIFIKSLEERVKTKRSEDFKTLFSEAIDEFGKGNYSKVLEICQRIISMDSENVAAKVLIERIKNMQK